MYRYSVDNAVTYTPDDFVLYRESSFAVWMERLTLENPDHGILPDLYSSTPEDSAECQVGIVDTLRAEGRDVTLIDWDLDEAERRRRTLAAMRDGADFIVDGQLALGALSGTANLLMRTSGYSDLGDFLYIPCDTQDKTTLQSGFRLCFLADLLHSLQGQLPPQMLVIRGDADVVPLQTEDHIYYFRAVKQRFMDDMREFRKHVMPDPSESSHFGRWADCASEVMKQRAQQAQEEQFEREHETVEEEAEFVAQPALRVAGVPGDAAITEDTVQDTAALAEVGHGAATTRATTAGTVTAEAATNSAQGTGQTLAEQARMLDPVNFTVDAAPGPSPNLSEVDVPPAEQQGTPTPAEPAEMPVLSESPVVPDSEGSPEHAALQGLSFIGSSSLSSSFEVTPIDPPEGWSRSAAPIDAAPGGPAPANSDERAPDAPLPIDELRAEAPGSVEGLEEGLERGLEDGPVDDLVDGLTDVLSGGLDIDTRQEVIENARPLPDLEPPEPFLLPPEDLVVAASPRQPRKPHPLDSTGSSVPGSPMVDLDDGAPPPSLSPLPSDVAAEMEKSPDRELERSDESPGYREEAAPALAIKTEAPASGADPDDILPRRSFSNSLMTSGDIDED